MTNVNGIENPPLAEKQDIFITPALRILKPKSQNLIFSNLNDIELMPKIFWSKI